MFDHVSLSDEQNEVVRELVGSRRPIQTLGGYAGTGKTTVIRTLHEDLSGYATVAFTGKAAHVLRKKDIPASTIHSAIYYPRQGKGFNEKGKLVSRAEFTLREEVECSGFIVDEASMVSENLYDDLLSFGKPIIFVGDHGQLEPVGDKFDLMRKPDMTLQTVHRNAGEIAYFAEFVRNGGDPVDWDGDGGQVLVTNTQDMSIDDLMAHDQFICAYNKTRVAINKDVRKLKGYPARKPVLNDRVMCLRNNHTIGVFNGMQGVVASDPYGKFDFASDGQIYSVEYTPRQFNKASKPEFVPKDKTIPFDYCYAITCHKAQGDEWDSVMVMEQKCKLWDHKRWAYTAASRAREKLTWVCD
jgi:exodeoxyribonuclease-5